MSKNLTHLVRDYGLKQVQQALPYMDEVFTLHFEKGMTYEEISEKYEITLERAVLAVECAVALDVVGTRWHRQFG